MIIGFVEQALGFFGRTAAQLRDFPRIFRAHRVLEYIVENDTPDVTPLRTAEAGYQYLSRLRVR
ncbi:hypothetical protein [Jiangella asiatica]|uniref:hypothetical protein n=1 Tax=Jiangella asiatica TaxID=2530372 RepID=UPI00193D292E|nr:hypothetical protein [Jiangella asiatica]